MNKRLSFIILMLVTSLSINCCAKGEVPDAIQTFVSSYFPKAKIVQIERDHEYDGIEYELKLDNGTEIHFNTDNQWKKVDCDKAKVTVPMSILPKSAASYINKNYPGQKVIEVKRDSYVYDVELSSKLELIFDSRGRFMRVDH